MAKPNLQSCYQKIGSLRDNLQNLQDRFGFSNITAVIHSAQIDLQQVPVHSDPLHWDHASSHWSKRWKSQLCELELLMLPVDSVSVSCQISPHLPCVCFSWWRMQRSRSSCCSTKLWRTTLTTPALLSKRPNIECWRWEHVTNTGVHTQSSPNQHSRRHHHISSGANQTNHRGEMAENNYITIF